MKKLFIIVFLLITTGCIGLYTTKEYRIKNIENNYVYKAESSLNRVYLTKPIGKEKNLKGRVVLGIEFTFNERENINLLRIRSSREDGIKNGETIYLDKEKYNKPKILDDVTITKKNGEKIILNKNKIVYTFEEKDFIKEALVYLPEELREPIILELGKIKIGDEIYDIPKIYMQRYRVTESYSLLGDILEEGGVYLPGYYSEGWVDD